MIITLNTNDPITETDRGILRDLLYDSPQRASKEIELRSGVAATVSIIR